MFEMLFQMANPEAAGEGGVNLAALQQEQEEESEEEDEDAN